MNESEKYITAQQLIEEFTAKTETPTSQFKRALFERRYSTIDFGIFLLIIAFVGFLVNIGASIL
jgi:hypothetical protein